MVSSYQARFREPEREHYPHTAEFMSRSFVTVKPETDIYEAMNILLKRKVSGAMVVNGEGNLAGFISEKDCLDLATHDTYESNLPGGPVANFMTTEVLTLTPEAGLNEVAELFMDKPYRKLPVLDHGRLVGVVRRHDVLEVIQQFYKKRMMYLQKVAV